MRKDSRSVWPPQLRKGSRSIVYMRAILVLVGLTLVQITMNVLYMSQPFSQINSSCKCDGAKEEQEFSVKTKTEERSRHRKTDYCLPYPYSLVGRMDINTEINTSLSDQKRAMPFMDWGEWEPPDCMASARVAIIIPYRNRLHHLTILLRYLHPFLQRQQVHYRIFLAEQAGVGTWNKGRVMNAGYLEAAKLFDFECVIFHDVDMVPEDDRNMYKCHDVPLHHSSAPSQNKYKTLYKSLVGGVLNFPREHFLRLNGYSNEYWGWGGEDDDMASRLKTSVFGFERVDTTIGRYTSLLHENRDTNPRRMALLKNAKDRKSSDGVTTVPYHVAATLNKKLFTHILLTI